MTLVGAVSPSGRPAASIIQRPRAGRSIGARPGGRAKPSRASAARLIPALSHQASGSRRGDRRSSPPPPARWPPRARRCRTGCTDRGCRRGRGRSSPPPWREDGRDRAVGEAEGERGRVERAEPVACASPTNGRRLECRPDAEHGASADAIRHPPHGHASGHRGEAQRADEGGRAQRVHAEIARQRHQMTRGTKTDTQVRPKIEEHPEGAGPQRRRTSQPATSASAETGTPRHPDEGRRIPDRDASGARRR